MALAFLCCAVSRASFGHHPDGTNWKVVKLSILLKKKKSK
jgi:hypothetical protein